MIELERKPTEPNYLILRRHLRELIPENDTYIEYSYPNISKTIKQDLVNSLHNPEKLLNGISNELSAIINNYKGTFGTNKQIDTIDMLVNDVSSNKRIGKMLSKNKEYIEAIETLKGYDTIFEEIYGKENEMTPIQEKKAFGNNSDISMDSPLSAPKYNYKKKKLDDFLEENELDKKQYGKMRRSIREHLKDDFNDIRKFVKGWSYSDMDGEQKDAVFEDWQSWSESGGTKVGYVREHNISSVYTLNKIIKENGPARSQTDFF